MKNILPKKKQEIYFRTVHAYQTCYLFQLFFSSKIAKIRDTLLSAKSDSNIHPEPTRPVAQILYSLSHNFRKVTCQSLFGHHPANHVT